MANNNAGFGGRAVRQRNGAPYSGQSNLYYFTGSGNLFVGDPVIITGAANTSNYYGNAAGTLPCVDIATAGDGNAISGFISGFFAEDFSSKSYGVGAAARGVYVTDDPEVVFEIQDDGLVTSTGAWCGASGNLVAGAGGSIYTNLSSWMLSSTTAATTSSQVKILRLSAKTNNALGQYAVWECMINKHTLNFGVAGI